LLFVAFVGVIVVVGGRRRRRFVRWKCFCDFVRYCFFLVVCIRVRDVHLLPFVLPVSPPPLMETVAL